MEILERLKRIQNKLQQLKTTDTEFKVFGSNEPWNGHKYELYQPVSEDELMDFEDLVNIKLPEEYKAYFSKVSNGGAGPYYGLYSFYQAVEDAVHYAKVEEENQHVQEVVDNHNGQRVGDFESEKETEWIITPVMLQKTLEPFPFSSKDVAVHIQKYIDFEEPEMFSMDEARGIIFLSEYGCGGYHVLVVNGEQAGKVWFFQSGEYISPCYSEIKDGFKQWGFFDFYEWWLDDSLAFLDDRVKPEKTDEDPLEKKNLIYDQQGLEAMPEEVFACKNLRQLVYSRNKLQILPLEVCDLTKLKILNLEMNGLEIIPAEVGKLHALTKLKLAYNGTLRTLPEATGMLHNLTELSLTYCSQLHKLPDSIGNLKKLEYLSCYSCDLEQLPDSIGDLESLITLSLGYNARMTQLPDSIGNLKKLKSLILECTKIKQLPESFVNLECLEYLDLTVNDLDWDNVMPLLALLPNLKTLKIEASAKPSNLIGLLKNVKTLTFTTNYQVKGKMLNLPQAVCDSHIEILHIEYSNAGLPEDLSKFQTLQELHLDEKQIGQVNESIKALKNLKVFHCHSQDISESIQNQIKQWLPDVDVKFW